MIHNNQDPEENFRDFINNIWSLSKLTHCYLDIQYPYATWLLEMSIISQSVKYLSTKNISYSSYSLLHLFKHTPYLQRLYIGSIGQCYDQHIQTIIPSLISLSMTAQFTLQWMKNLFQQIPNLCYLTLEINNIYLDGQEWEKILSNYFHNIKIFRLKMTIEFSPLENIEEQVDQLIDSFRSYYWIEKHHWFVRCDWCPMDINQTGLLYTLPYAFDTFYYIDSSQSKSTSPNNFDYSFRNQSKILHYTTNHKRDYSKNKILYPIQFFNIRHLKIKLPFNDAFLSLIPKLDQLISLDVTLNNRDLGYSQLQTLLDRASHLYSLRFCHLNNFSMTSFNITSTSIRRLEFFQHFDVRLRYFNSKECTILANSSLAFQCEVLMIDVESRTNILELINIMPSLRALSVRCKDNESNQNETFETNDNLIEWLHQHLPSKYTYSINRNVYNIARINVWIYKAS
ncbi:unnamed protein product [Rotaria sordida]|uniref:Uncharacterized protein n=1 Tax=Rotaria sordida TaxID=392033 RepID=A0A813ZW09_9BILA|nr:unnamed protein product [Rotaria sordida]CAF4069940.1 unnamed protein product [Rotaria sordida]